jgi:hypothetical protein
VIQNASEWVFERFGVFVVIIIIILIAFVGYIIMNASSDFERADLMVKDCMASEQYTREECIIMAGGEH